MIASEAAGEKNPEAYPLRRTLWGTLRNSSS